MTDEGSSQRSEILSRISKMGQPMLPMTPPNPSSAGGGEEPNVGEGGGGSVWVEGVGVLVCYVHLYSSDRCSSAIGSKAGRSACLLPGTAYQSRCFFTAPVNVPTAAAIPRSVPVWTANGGSANVDGTTADGSTADGTAANGIAVDGSAADGSAADGTTVDGTAVNGTTADGSTDDVYHGSASALAAAGYIPLPCTEVLA